MRIFIIASALFATTPALASPATPVQLEMETWRAFQAGRVAEFKSMFAPVFVGVYADGTHDLAREMQVFRHVKINSYTLSEMDSHVVDADDVLLTYTADVRGVVDGKARESRLNTASLWHRQRAGWRCVYHTEIKAN